MPNRYACFADTQPYYNAANYRGESFNLFRWISSHMILCVDPTNFDVEMDAHLRPLGGDSQAQPGVEPQLFVAAHGFPSPSI